MKSVGVISVQRKKGKEKNGSIWKFFFNEAVVKSQTVGGVRFIVADVEIPNLKNTLISAICFKIAYSKAVKCLNERNTDFCVTTEDTKKIAEEYRCTSAVHGVSFKKTPKMTEFDSIAPNTEESGIPDNKIAECLMYCVKINKSPRTFGTLVVSDKELKVADADFLARFCMYAKNIILRTSIKDKAEKIADVMLSEFGVCIDIVGCEGADIPSAMLVNVDKGYVRVADLILDGVLYDEDCMGYNIDIRAIAKALGDNADFKVKAWKSGNNVIEIENRK